MHMGREKRDTLFKDFEALTYGTKELKLHGERHDSFIDEVLHSTSFPEVQPALTEGAMRLIKCQELGTNLIRQTGNPLRGRGGRPFSLRP